METDGNENKSLDDPQQLAFHIRKGTQSFEEESDLDLSSNASLSGNSLDDGRDSEKDDDDEEEEEDEGGARQNGRRRRTTQTRESSKEHRRRVPYQAMPGEAITRLLLPASRIGFVIGRGGDVVKGICETTGAHVSIATLGADGRDTQYRMATVTGSVMAACWAVELVAVKAGLFDGHGTINAQYGRRNSSDGEHGGDDEEASSNPPGMKMIIQSTSAGSVIGKGGKTISEIRTQARARVLVLDDEESAKEGAIEEERVVIVVGGAEACRRAHQLISAALTSEFGRSSRHSIGGSRDMTDYSSSRHKASDSGDKPSYGLGNLTLSGSGTIPGTEDEGDGEPACEVIVRVSSDVIGRVIGKEGSNINRIRKKSGCRILIGNTRPGEPRNLPRLIRIQGTMKHTQLAQQLITEQLASEE